MTTTSRLPIQLPTRRYETKRGINYNVLLIGSNGIGKTTLANNLINSNYFKHKYPNGTNSNSNDIDLNDTSLFNDSYVSNGVKVISPTKVIVSSNNNDNNKNENQHLYPKVPSNAHIQPGFSLTSTSLDVSSHVFDGTIDEIEKNQTKRSRFISKLNETIFHLNIFMSHGLGENFDESLYFKEISKFFENQFDKTINEETRIKRNLNNFKDTRIHVALYFIESLGHGLKEIDVKLMKLLSKYTNVLPIISKADSLTDDELNNFKSFIKKDLEKYDVNIYNFPYDRMHDDIEVVKEHQFLSSLQPFAITCSDNFPNCEREYPWGKVSTNDILDLSILKKVLFGSHLHEFKDITENVLYEKYRCARLIKIGKDVNVINNKLHSKTTIYNSDDDEDNDDLVSNNSEDSFMTPRSSTASSFTPDTPIQETFESTHKLKAGSIFKMNPTRSVRESANIVRAKNMSKSVPFMFKNDYLASKKATSKSINDDQSMISTEVEEDDDVADNDTIVEDDIDINLKLKEMELKEKELKLKELRIKELQLKELKAKNKEKNREKNYLKHKASFR